MLVMWSKIVSAKLTQGWSVVNSVHSDPTSQQNVGKGKAANLAKHR